MLSVRRSTPRAASTATWCVADNFSNGLHFQAGASPRIEDCTFVNNTGLGLCHISANDAPNDLFSNVRVIDDDLRRPR